MVQQGLCRTRRISIILSHDSLVIVPQLQITASNNSLACVLVLSSKKLIRKISLILSILDLKSCPKMFKFCRKQSKTTSQIYCCTSAALYDLETRQEFAEVESYAGEYRWVT